MEKIDKDESNDVHAIKDELSKLGKEFSRFNERLRKLEAHIGQAHKDVSDIRATTEKIVARFGKIKKL